MALSVDGWHMATHAAALGIAGIAYLFARQHARQFGDLAAAGTYKRRLSGLHDVSHVTVEVEACPHHPLAEPHAT